MQITFLYPRWTGDYGFVARHFARQNAVWPPLNLAVLGAMAEQQGHQVTIIDGEAENLSEDQILNRALAVKSDLIGLTCYSPFFSVNDRLAKRLKETGCKVPIMAGGPHITIMKEKVFYPEFDYLFLGEAEVTFPGFLDTYEKGGDLSKVPGLIYRKGNEPVIGQAAWIEPKEKVKGSNVNDNYAMDEFPLPARHLLPMEKYYLGTIHGRKHFTAIQTKRGCPWTCIFCASAVLNTTRVITRSPQSIVAEMKDVIVKYPYITHFYFNDDVMFLFEAHIREVCRLMIAEGLNKKVTFEGATRANQVNEPLIELAKEAGLARLAFGLETVDTEMRKTMEKKVPLHDYGKAADICEKYGVEAYFSVMVGLPGETHETVKNTLDYLRKARNIYQCSFSVAIPYPGTKFNDIAVAGTHGVVLKDKDFSNYKRYGSAVTQIGEMTPQDLLDTQNIGFVSIYSAPWRWIPMIKRQGWIGFILLMFRVVNAWRKIITKKAMEPWMGHPKG